MALTKPKKETKPKKPETLQDYKDQGWEVGPVVGMSNPPTYFLSKDGKTIRFRPKMKLNPNMPKRPKDLKPKPFGGVPDIPKRKMPKSGGKGLGKRAAEKIKEYLDKKDRAIMPLNKKSGGLAGRLATRGYGKANR